MTQKHPLLSQFDAAISQKTGSSVPDDEMEVTSDSGHFSREQSNVRN